MGDHLIDGEFQSDKYPTTPRGKVPLSVKDPTAQDLLWQYAQRRRGVDAEFSDDLEEALRRAGYVPDVPTDLDALEMSLAESTGGKWEWECRGLDNQTLSLVVPQKVFPEATEPFCWGHPLNLLNTKADEWDGNGRANRAILVAARNALPGLLAEVRELRRACQQLREKIDAQARLWRQDARCLRREIARGVCLRQSAESKEARAEVLDVCAGALRRIVPEPYRADDDELKGGR